MSKLPTMVASDGIQQDVQAQFGGLNHTLSAGQGDLFWMENLTSDEYPLLSTRKKRYRIKTLAKPNGIFGEDELCHVDGTAFYYGGEKKGEVTDSQKTFAAMGNYILIFPDKKYYNKYLDEFGSLEASVTGSGCRFEDGTIYGETAEQNTITCSSVDFRDYFSEGDGITVSGCTTVEGNNKTMILREISEDGHSLRFSEFALTLTGAEGDQPYTEPGTITFARTVPDMDFICTNENRLWGCKGDEVFCSKLGDPKNFNVFDGVATDSWSTPAGSAGDFTGCVSYLGYPIFFKEDHIYKVYGDYAQAYRLMGSASMGVAKGSGRSLAIAGEILLYLSRNGIMGYSGGIPSPLFEVFGTERYKNAVGGSDGIKYYVSMENSQGEWSVFVYDTSRGLWHREDGRKAVAFARQSGNLCALWEDGCLWLMSNPVDVPEGAEEEPPVNWIAEWADLYGGSDKSPYPGKKGISKLILRLAVEEGAQVTVEISYDGGDWEQAAVLDGSKKRSYYLPVIPRRADYYRLRLHGVGEARVYSITKEYYSGSALKSTKGRN